MTSEDRRNPDGSRVQASIHLGIYYDEQHSLWAHCDGAAVCQDHARPLPCPYHRRTTDPGSQRKDNEHLSASLHLRASGDQRHRHDHG